MNLRPYGWPDDTVEGLPVWTDASFSELLRRHPQLGALRSFLPPSAASTCFDGQVEINTLQSSYVARGYGSLIYSLIRVLEPIRAVEIGILRGFSLFSAAAALRDNGAGRIAGYDLFGAYAYQHAERDQVQQQMLAFGLGPWVTIDTADVDEVHDQWEWVDYLHVDVSNTGDTCRRVFEHWSPKVRQIILLEGGSTARDNVAWMRRYRKPAIAPVVADLALGNPGWSFTVLEPFPSLTVMCNRSAIAALPSSS